MLRMGGQPVVDELLDDAAPAKRRADVVPAAIAVEVLHQLLVARVALARLRDLRGDVRVRDCRALDLRDPDHWIAGGLRPRSPRLEPPSTLLSRLETVCYNQIDM